MKLFVLTVTNETGDESVWTAFDDDSLSATDRFLEVRGDTDYASLDVRELPLNEGARFGRPTPDMMIVQHSGLWTSLSMATVSVHHARSSMRH